MWGIQPGKLVTKTEIDSIDPLLVQQEAAVAVVADGCTGIHCLPSVKLNLDPGSALHKSGSLSVKRVGGLQGHNLTQ